MRQSKGLYSLTIAAVLLCMLPVSAACAEQTVEGLGSNYDIIILTPGHSRTIFYELHNTVLNDPSAFQATLVVTLGAGFLTVGVANSSAVGQGSELVFSTVGYVFPEFVLDYSYSSAPISKTIEVGDFSAGFLVTGIMYNVGSIDFPVTMSMTFSLN